MNLTDLFDHSLFSFHFFASSSVLSKIIWATINTGIKFGAWYLLIRVFITAFEHGSF